MRPHLITSCTTFTQIDKYIIVVKDNPKPQFPSKPDDLFHVHRLQHIVVIWLAFASWVLWEICWYTETPMPQWGLRGCDIIRGHNILWQEYVYTCIHVSIFRNGYTCTVHLAKIHKACQSCIGPLNKVFHQTLHN